MTIAAWRTAEITFAAAIALVVMVSGMPLTGAASDVLVVSTAGGVRVLDTENSPPSIVVYDEPAVEKATPWPFYSSCTDWDLNDSIQLTWIWDDGTVSVTNHQSTGGTFTATCVHEYLYRGNYILTVWIDDLTGLEGHNVSDWAWIHVGMGSHPPTIALFTVDSQYPLTGEIVTFSATVTDIDSDLCTLTFYFGDGLTEVVTQSAPNSTDTVLHEYTSEGIYQAQLTASDGTVLVASYLIDMIVSRASFDLELAAGWNLVTIPLANHGYRSNTLGLTFGDVVVGWNSSAASYDEAYIEGVSPPSYGFPIEDGAGYWIFSQSARSLSLVGSVPTGLRTINVSVPAGGGWALIGLTSLKTWHASEIPLMFDGGGDIAVVVIWDPGNLVYRSYYPGIPPTDFLIPPGVAFWCFCTSSGSLAYES